MANINSRIISDLSGTLVDMSDRQYHTYLYCLSKLKYDGQPLNYMSKGDFRKARQSSTSLEYIALKSGLDKAQVADFIRSQKQVINSPCYMKHDQLFPETTHALEMAKVADIDLVLLTMRRESELKLAFENALPQGYFPQSHIYCISDDFRKSSDIHDKSCLLEKALSELPHIQATWMIGDTEADIIAAKLNGINSIAVLTGSRNYERLSIYEPDFIADNILEAVKFIANVSID